MTDQPFRIQTASGYRKYLCSGLYMPSVTTVLSATESAKSKASLKTWQQNLSLIHISEPTRPY